jgi:hypothetical protein
MTTCIRRFTRFPRLALIAALVLPLSAGSVPSLATAPALVAPALDEADQIGKEFEEILAQPEFRRLRTEKAEPTDAELPEWFKKFLDWLGDLFTVRGGNYSGLGGILQALAYAVLAAVCCLIIWLVVRAVQSYRGRNRIGARGRRNFEEGEGDLPPGDLPADEYLRRAAELAQQGKFREAIGQLILGAMSRAERAGLIRFRRGLTNRDYLRALRSQGPQHEAFRAIVGVYEPICFGRRTAEANHYLASLGEYQAGFREAAPAIPTGPKPLSSGHSNLSGA